MILQIGASLGRAIALGGKPDISQAVSIAQRDKERRAREQTAERVSREKKRKELDEYIGSIEVDYTKFDPIDFEDVRIDTAEYIKTMRGEQDKDPQGNYRNTENALKARREFNISMAGYKARKKEFTGLDTFLANPKNRELIDLDPELYAALQKARQDPSRENVETFNTLSGSARGAIVSRDKFFSIKQPTLDIISVQKKITSSIDAVLQDLAPKLDAAGNWIYSSQINKEAYRKRMDAQADLAWQFTPSIQANFPAREGEEFSQEFRDTIWQGREIPKKAKQIRAGKEDKVAAGKGYSTKNYSFPSQWVEIKPDKPITKIEKGIKTFTPLRYKKVPEYLITRKDKTELSFLEFDVTVIEDGVEKKKTQSIRPYSIRKLGEDYYFFGEDKETKEDVYIPYEDVSEKLKAKFEGMTLELLKGEPTRTEEEKTNLRSKYDY